MGSGVDFEIHVVNKAGVEVGIFGSDGFMNKHRLSGDDVNVPDSVNQRLKGIAIDEMRKAGRISSKGEDNIKGDNWKRPRLKGCN
ncbi:hypothetical protein ACFSX9_10625 [Flavobacterium ardleyense]|uniref:Uncharacterized protein n=1 Tax=Flavobacterium ardleyense TaxID=2038737 RepID=A0ABW5ZAE5_9FLAO